jgi:hypothetical protein
VSDEESLSSGSLSKQESEKLFLMLEAKLGHERQAWQRAKAQIRVVRALSFLFLLVLILGTVVGFYVLRARAEERRLNSTPQTTVSEP